jgi:dTDP-4-dehydrorhamnose 3,5-epimerase
MNVIACSMLDIPIIAPKVFGDTNRFFHGSFNLKTFNEVTSQNHELVQNNRNAGGVLRGLLRQLGQLRDRLLRLMGSARFDGAVDLRKGSPNFGKWAEIERSEDTRQQSYVPPNVAHGFVVLDESAKHTFVSPQLAAKDMPGAGFDSTSLYGL